MTAFSSSSVGVAFNRRVSFSPAKNQPLRQPMLNLQIAKAYLAVASMASIAGPGRTLSNLSPTPSKAPTRSVGSASSKMPRCCRCAAGNHQDQGRSAAHHAALVTFRPTSFCTACTTIARPLLALFSPVLWEQWSRLGFSGGGSIDEENADGQAVARSGELGFPSLPR